MILDKCTRKLQEVFLQAEKFARSKSHNQLSSLHLMSVFLLDREGTVFEIFELVEIDLSLLAQKISDEIDLLPEQVGGVDSLKPSKSFNEIIAQSELTQKSRKLFPLDLIRKHSSSAKRKVDYGSSIAQISPLEQILLEVF